MLLWPHNSCAEVYWIAQAKRYTNCRIGPQNTSILANTAHTSFIFVMSRNSLMLFTFSWAIICKRVCLENVPGCPFLNTGNKQVVPQSAFSCADHYAGRECAKHWFSAWRHCLGALLSCQCCDCQIQPRGRSPLDNCCTALLTLF